MKNKKNLNELVEFYESNLKFHAEKFHDLWREMIGKIKEFEMEKQFKKHMTDAAFYRLFFSATESDNIFEHIAPTKEMLTKDLNDWISEMEDEDLSEQLAECFLKHLTEDSRIVNLLNSCKRSRLYWKEDANGSLDEILDMSDKKVVKKYNETFGNLKV
jgi:hypothetical protein